MYKPTVLFPVYCHECWWSDQWDPLDFGKEYDATVPFFEQFKDLLNKTPRPSAYSTSNSESEYCNYTAHMKRGYLMFGSWFSENCSYGQTVLESKDCWDSLFIRNCEACFASVDSVGCSKLFFGQNCSQCIDSAFLFDCKNCQNCLLSYNLRNKNYYVLNKQVSKEEFEATRKNIFSSRAKFEDAFTHFRKLVRESAIHKFMTGERNNTVSGEFIYSSKNVRNSYYIYDGENENYAVRGGKGQKDSMDVFGVHAGELVYECNNIDFSSNCFFSVNGEQNISAYYLVDCDHVSNSFGCVSLRKNEYCILNKVYTREEYEKLYKKMVSEMSSNPYADKNGKISTFGEFFPIELSPHAYNETLAQEYVPVTEIEAKERGYAWDSFEEKNYTPTKHWKDMAENAINDSLLKEVILCRAWDEDKHGAQNHKCTQAFKIIPDELAMYQKWHLPLPQECPNTRNFKMAQLRNPVHFWQRECMCESEDHDHVGKCQTEFKTSYAPERPEIIYCEKCYQAEVI